MSSVRGELLSRELDFFPLQNHVKESFKKYIYNAFDGNYKK